MHVQSVYKEKAPKHIEACINWQCLSKGLKAGDADDQERINDQRLMAANLAVPGS